MFNMNESMNGIRKIIQTSENILELSYGLSVYDNV